ncbi:unnamed protein product, partial [Meganyctiphanes norvegica]
MMHRDELFTLLVVVVNLRSVATITQNNTSQCKHTDESEWVVECVSHNWSELECCWRSPWNTDTYTVALDAGFGKDRCGPENGCCHWTIPHYLPSANEQTLRYTHHQAC